MVKLFLNDIKMIAIAIAILAVLAIAGYIYYKGGSEMASKITMESIKTDIEIQEKKDEIRNNRPDVDDLIIILHNGKF